METQPNVTDWMSAWGQVIGAVGGLAGFIALGLELWKQRGKRLRPPQGLIESLMWLEEALGDVIAQGGKESMWFLTPERRRNEALLAAVAGQIQDDDLNGLVGDARAGYLDAFSLAPGDGQLRAPGNAERVQQQIERASFGRARCTTAFNRANDLLQKHPP